jgi:4-diphosphocytidyl-2C-methyl-D-erythritol kinase
MACDGAKVVRMSGSGATCFALFDDFDLLVSAQNKVSKDCASFWCKAGRLI